jgi:glucose-6-phosphate 1-dehydrogenase
MHSAHTLSDTLTAPGIRPAPADAGRPAGPCAMVIFGVGGDLTKRKLFPALYNLAKDSLLPREFAVIGVGRSASTTAEFQKKISQGLHEFATTDIEPALVDWLTERLYYHTGNFQDPGAYQKLGELLNQVDQKHATGGNYFYYLATAPDFFGEITRQLGAAALTRQSDAHWRRVVYEKPFGHDLDSARSLNHEIEQVLEENQIYRIDHYLGKETVQNILAFRFGNGIFEPVWNRRFIDHVQITVAETIGVETRGGYYDQSGALRDMVPNHLFQLVSLVAMEPPISFDANAVRDEQTKVLRAIQPLTEQDVLTRTVRGQYGEGLEDGTRLAAYRSEPRVSPNSATETFTALKLQIDNWRWAGIPFYLRTGKRLKTRASEIVIQFKSVPFQLFRRTAVERLAPNQLLIRIQPQEGISLQFGAKIPGPIVRLGSVNMDFRYADYFGSKPSTGYERLLYECMVGDATLFQRADMVEASWSAVQPILDVWQALPPRNFPNYPAGSWGPWEASELLERDGRQWREPSE